MWFLTIWSYIKRGFVWIGKNIWKFFGAFFAGLSVVLGIAYLVQKNKAKSYEADANFIALKTKVASLDEIKDLVLAENEHDEEAIANIEKVKDQLKAEVEEIRQVHNMSDEEVLREFRRLYK